ncbi:OLC1v1027593C1 [Oldenlandia corymbosa var. corymbosa]|uniref:OLC1v1027593C1 n=1 Tax=Oldenlandia corymbosa var. corymbosa TaxID=529605 RepID=A0AAV1CB08_OLDCO|nr:OLC1v1027593C1 [Oldenlandia corymbosa var. corymbosa]
MGHESLCEYFVDSEFDETTNQMGSGNSSGADDIFSVLEAWEAVSDFNPMTPLDEGGFKLKESDTTRLLSQKSTSSSTTTTTTTAVPLDSENELETSRNPKRQKLVAAAAHSDEANRNNPNCTQDGGGGGGGQQRMTHITVERNRRKQMNDHLTVLRSLMPCFYVKRGDQASIIGGVVNYINELQQVLQSLEAKKQRKVYSEVLSPRIAVSSPRTLSQPQPSPRKPPLSPRLSLPISPRTPQPTSPYKPPASRLPPQLQGGGLPSPCSSSTTNSSIINDSVNELVAHSKSAVAEVEVKFSGPNVLLKTVSPRLPGQVVKIISTLEDLSLEILQLDISNIDDSTIMFSFTIKIGIECQLSAEELAQQIQLTFC